MRKKFLKNKKVVAIFGIIAFIGGLFFTRQGKITGNIITNNYYDINFLSLIGILLLLCAIIAAIYIIKRK